MPDQDPLDYVLSKLEGVKPGGGGWDARCPVPDHGEGKGDRRRSLHVARGDTQPVVVKCHAGCEQAVILAALGLAPADVCQPREARDALEWKPGSWAEAIYDYTDEEGRLLSQKLRLPGKDFRQRAPKPGGGWTYSLAGVRRVLYRLPDVVAAVAAGERVWVVEGEKDADNLRRRKGVVATCNPEGGGKGACKWRPEYTEVLRDARVGIVADADPEGRKHARGVAEALEGVAACVVVMEAAVGKDATDHLDAGKGLGQFAITSAREAAPVLAPTTAEFLAGEDPPIDWVLTGLVERRDKLFWTGREGLGKSTVVRQLAACTACGYHPFMGTLSASKSVLIIDCENSVRRSRRAWRVLDRTMRNLGRPIPDGSIRHIHRPAGINLLDRDEAAEFLEQVRAHRPDLLIMGPLWKLHETDMNEEREARRLTKILDMAMEEADCALIVEVHSPHGPSVRPVGSSALLRWPDFGMGIKPSGKRATDDLGHVSKVRVVNWRGPRDDRHWPGILRWGAEGRGELPWVADTREAAGVEPDADADAQGTLDDVTPPGGGPTLDHLEVDAAERAMGHLREGGLLPPGEGA